MLRSLSTPEMNGRPLSGTAHVSTPHEGEDSGCFYATPELTAHAAVRRTLMPMSAPPTRTVGGCIT